MILAALLLASSFQIQSNFWVNLHQRLQHESDAIRDVLVRAAPFAGPVGAFTGDVKVTHTTISSLHPNYRGVFALEMMLHESSHGVFDEELVGDRAKKLGLEAPPNLWHAILFYTSGELTRRFLGTRGIDDYKPVAHAAGVFKRGDNPRYVPLLETTWQQHIDGKLSLDDAISSMITHLASKK